jgi:large subunit ribosomal protein L29
MLKATDLRERTLTDLHELEKTLKNDVFQNRFKNFTNRLDDTSSIKKAKKDLARVKTILTERAKALTPVESAAKAEKVEAPAAPVAAEVASTKEAAPKAPAKAKKATAPKAEAKAATTEAAPAKKTATKTKTAKKSEAE